MKLGSMLPGGSNRPELLSRDHILPQSQGGRNTMYGDTRNIREVCRSCNGNLAAAMQCVGALKCAMMVADDTRTPLKYVFRQWRFGEMLAAGSADGISKIARRNQRAMRVSELTKGEYIWPANTAAKQVWNLATLSMARYIVETEEMIGERL